MAQTVGNHQQSLFANPQNGQVPIDAGQVRTNDNALTTSYNAHDNDEGLHVQSSAIGSRPAAGVAGRKWFATDTFLFSFDDGTNWHGAAYLELANGGTVAGATVFSSTVAITGVLTATGGVTGNASTATALQTARTIAATGDVAAAGVSFDGSGNISLTTVLQAGVVANSHIASAAGIVDSKLATISTTGKVANSATTAVSASTANTIVLRDSSGNFAANVITVGQLTINGVAYTFPGTDGTMGQVLQTNGSRVLTWAAPSSGFITGGGTTGTLAKWTGSSAVGNSSVYSEASSVATISGTLVVTGAGISIGSTPATTGYLRLPNVGTIVARNNANNADHKLLSYDSSNICHIAQDAGGLALGPAGLFFPGTDGTNGQLIATNGSGALSFVSLGGISGLSANKVPKASSGTALTDSLISDSGSLVTLGGPTTLGATSTDSITFVGGVAADVPAHTDNTVDLGTSSKQFRNLRIGTGVFVGGVGVLGARNTGWAPTFSGVTSSKTATIDGSALNITNFNLLQDFVRGLYDAQVAHGLIGP